MTMSHDSETERTAQPVDTSEGQVGTLSTADFASAGANRTPVARHDADRSATERRDTPLFPGSEAQGFQSRWSDIQVSFVDEPRQSVQQADALVAEVMQRLAQVFADERSRLDQQWDRGEQTDTEALRQALRRYRSFFDRLLSM